MGTSPGTVLGSPFTRLRPLAASALFATALGCAHGDGTSTGPNHRSVHRLLSAVMEKPTARFPQSRTDLELDGKGPHSNPHVVGGGETPSLRLQGRHARLYGDNAATQGFSVDNGVLLEIFTGNGKLYSSVVVGMVEALILNHSPVDNLGRMAFRFDPGEVDITPKLPEQAAFSIRATALDLSGVGRVSDVYLVMENTPARATPERSLRNE